MKIHIATSSDVPALCDLLTMLFSQEAEFTPNRDAQRRGLSAIIDDPRVGTILVARDQARIVGMVNLLYTVSTALGEKVALLEDMIVAPQVRVSGVGTLLLREAISLARAKRCKRITLLTDTANEAAQRFYRKQGFEISTMVSMRLILE